MISSGKTLALLSLLSCIVQTQSLSIITPDLHLHFDSLSLSASALPSIFSRPVPHLESPTFLAATTDADPSFFEIAGTVYRQQLRNDPLKTKVLTGIFLAVIGDALAQSREPAKYNVKRALSFATFDGCYRAVQQFTYPPMMQLCSGKFLTSVLSSLGVASVTVDQLHLAASVEQTLVSQLVIIPTLYYPVFYAVTGAVQGLTMQETITRAKETFIPLMKRNLQFWIPVQFFAFAFVEENLQIPILIVCGLVWTIILSVAAGAAKVETAEETESLGIENVVLQEDGAYYISGSNNSHFAHPEKDMKNIDVADRLMRLARAQTTTDLRSDRSEVNNPASR